MARLLPERAGITWENFEMIQRSQIWSQINMNEREWLAHYVEQHEKRIELMKPHCEIAIPK
jgi:hypothetical protein